MGSDESLDETLEKTRDRLAVEGTPTQAFEQTGGGEPVAAGEDPARLRPGDTFGGRWRITRFIDRGGFSFVFAAEQLATGERVALKFLSNRLAGGDAAERLRRELRLARDLRHPNIVRVFELVEAEGHRCLVMELIDGRTLKDLVLERGALPLEEARRLLLGIVSAMAAVHAAGIVHRDLKPQNVLVTADGEIKLLDFGLAKTPTSTGLTATGTILGTPDYMAPEQVEGKRADTRADVYALGVIGWELLAGKPPFSGDSPLAIALQHVRSRVPDSRSVRPETPLAWATLLGRMTDPAPARRPASAQEVLLELMRVSATPERVGGSRPGRWLVTASAVALVGIGGWAGWHAWGPAAGETVDPWSDGVVEVALATEPPREEIGGGQLFLDALRQALPSRLDRPFLRLATAEEGSEELLIVGLERPAETAGGGRELAAGGFAYRVVARVVDPEDRGRTLRELASVPVRSLDFEAIDVVSGAVSEEYLATVGAAR